ncbi:hypothetical protein ERY430_40211 [Erythrobacter sp. EC-HK427]|nr:hypothetical protein ERY430_40211 [Erythrobacter sp. EC-HK427]
MPFSPTPSKGGASCAGVLACTVRLAAGVAELVDALVLGTSILRCGGSSPFARTSFAWLDGRHEPVNGFE